MLVEFKGTRLLLARAGKHLSELSSQLDELSKTISVIQIVEPEGQEYVMKARLNGHLPDELSVVAKDVITDLRDALDHAVYASAAAIIGGEPRKTKFMAGRSESAIKDDIKRGRYTDVPKPIMDLMWSFRPFEGGHPILSTFNELRNQKTHRTLVPFIYKHGGTVSMSVTHVGPEGFRLEQMGGDDIWDQEKQELTLARLGTSPHSGIKFETSFDIVIHGTDIAGKHQPALQFLNAAASEFARIVSAIEAETIKTIDANKTNA